MSLEKELNKVLSEALPPRREPPANLAGRGAARKPAQPAQQPQQPVQPSSPQQRSPDFAGVRKAMRRPMVNLDAQVHNIDKMLNATQKDPSQLGSTVQQIEKSFNGILDPLKQVRDGVKQLRQAADEFNAEYVGEKEQEQPAEKQGLPEMTPGMEKPQKRIQALAGKAARTDLPESSVQRRKSV